MPRRRRVAIILGLSALAVVAALAPVAESRDLPTAGQIDRATGRFLAAHPDRGAPAVPGGGIGDPALASLPSDRVVALYGAPQMGRTILGLTTPAQATRRLASYAAAYEGIGVRPVAGELDLVSVFATAAGGPDGLYRTRQSDDVIQIYLDQARLAGARLMLDIEPGRSSFAAELAALSSWVAEPDVDVALDPEWNVGRRGIPGRTRGAVTAREVNAVSRRMAAIVRDGGLPPKLLVVHQFSRAMVRGRARIRQRASVQVVLNFDGIGSPAAKANAFAALTAPRLFNGFSLFLLRDSPLMRPPAVLALDPEPDFLLYQ